MNTAQSAGQISGYGKIHAVEDVKELSRLENSILDVTSLASEVAAKLEALADALGFYDQKSDGSAPNCAPSPGGLVPRLHDHVHTARGEVSRIHRAFERLNSLA